MTGRYKDLTPRFNSGILIRSLSYAGVISGNGALRQKWRVTLMDGKEWRIYAVANVGQRELQLRLINNSQIRASGTFSGIIQIGKLSNNVFETVLDSTAGTVVTDAVLSAGVTGTVGTYTFNFATTGGSTSQAPLMYALPHHLASFDYITQSKVVNGLELKSTTKGMMTAVVTTSWVLTEADMPVSVGWLPGSNRKWSGKALDAIRKAVQDEIGFDVVNASNLSSQYFSGKVGY